MFKGRGLRAVALVACLPLLAACENSATAYAVDSPQHALTLVREQPYFWTDHVNQFVVVSRLPVCQRKVEIHADAKALTPIDLYEAGDRLWAMRQGERWYLASTEACAVQDWVNPTGQPPGPPVGSFRPGDNGPDFVRAAAG